MPEKKMKAMLGLKNLAILLSYFDYIFVHLKAVNHPANFSGLQQLKLNYNFWYFLF